MAGSDVAALAATLGQPQDFTLTRPDDRDLVFRGWQLSRERDCIGSGMITACTEVFIYITVSSLLVTQVRRWREHEGKPESEQQRVAYHGTPELALSWLKADNKGALGVTSKKAWVAACKRHPKLTGQDVERIS